MRTASSGLAASAKSLSSQNWVSQRTPRPPAAVLPPAIQRVGCLYLARKKRTCVSRDGWSEQGTRGPSQPGSPRAHQPRLGRRGPRRKAGLGRPLGLPGLPPDPSRSSAIFQVARRGEGPPQRGRALGGRAGGRGWRGGTACSACRIPRTEARGTRPLLRAPSHRTLCVALSAPAQAMPGTSMFISLRRRKRCSAPRAAREDAGPSAIRVWP